MDWNGIHRETTPLDERPEAAHFVKNARLCVTGENRRRHGYARSSIAKQTGAILGITSITWPTGTAVGMTVGTGGLGGGGITGVSDPAGGAGGGPIVTQWGPHFPGDDGPDEESGGIGTPSLVPCTDCAASTGTMTISGRRWSEVSFGLNMDGTYALTRFTGTAFACSWLFGTIPRAAALTHTIATGLWSYSDGGLYTRVNFSGPACTGGSLSASFTVHYGVPPGSPQPADITVTVS